jgi:hypothetical protein
VNRLSRKPDYQFSSLRLIKNAGIYSDSLIAKQQPNAQPLKEIGFFEDLLFEFLR